MKKCLLLFACLAINFALSIFAFAAINQFIENIEPVKCAAIVTCSMFIIEQLGQFLGYTINLTGYAFAISYSSIDIRGKVYEPIIEEILFENATISQGLVVFEEDIKAETIFTETKNTVAMQAYTSGAPGASGTMTLTDTSITPTKVMYYSEFDPNTLRTTRFKRDMKAGAWNTLSNEFETVVIGGHAKAISFDAESKFWNSATAATQALVAGLVAGAGQGSVGAAEQAYVASLTAGQIDGVITRVIFNGGVLGTRIKVAGTTISSTNVAAEYAKAYAAIPPQVLNNPEMPYMYAPYSHKQFINIFNITAAFRDLFSVSADKKTYYYNGVEIKFAPLPENCILAAKKSHLAWCTDLLSDVNYVVSDKVLLNADTRFIKNVFTIFAHVMNQRFNVLYLG